MKTEELCLNNIVSDGIFQFYITEITKGVVKGLLIDFSKSTDEIQDEMRLSATYSLNIENLSGIPLNEEWLMKFGFEKLNRDVPAFENKKLIIEWLFERYAFTSIQIIEVKSVHQIHNLYYALTGTELTIK